MSEQLVDLSEFHETFFAEASEHVATLESMLLQIEGDLDNRELMHSAFRAAHSLKGSAGIFGFTEITHFTHALETLLDAVRNGELPWSGEIGSAMLESVDVIRTLLAAPDAKLDEAGEVTRLRLLSLAHPGAPESAAEPPPTQESVAVSLPPGGDPVFDVRFFPVPEIFKRGTDPILVLRDLARAGRVLERRVSTKDLPSLADLDPTVFHLGWEAVVACEGGQAELDEVFEFVVGFGDISVKARHGRSAPKAVVSVTSAPTEAPSLPQSAAGSVQFLPSFELGAALLQQAPPVISMPEMPQSNSPSRPGGSASIAPPRPSARPSLSAPGNDATVRIATKKLDRILDLVGELVVSKSMISAALKRQPMAQDLREALGTLERHTRELQDSVMAVRMVPMSSVFGRFPRVVRELGAKLGKDVQLELEGTQTEIDRAMVEQLADPLTHLVRNSVDHGLETGDARVAAGKSSTGRLVLSASHRGGNVVIEIRDDGRGLDVDRVRQRAVERGLLLATDQPSVEQLHMMVFEPGFSTAAAVTDVSGRGVGMDVVKRNVEALGGAIQFTSERGKGSLVRLQLPLTMAIIDGLVLRVGRSSFVVPLLAVVESLRPTPDLLHTVLGKGRVFSFRGAPIPLVALSDVLQVGDGETDPTKGIVVVVESGGETIGLVVDELLADGQVVVKSLEANYKRLDGLAGATVMGDGTIALILDVPALARLAVASASRLALERVAA